MDDHLLGKKRVTLRDIAKEVGCSHVAVSLALRNSTKVSKARGDEIRRKAEEMGYRPDPVLKQLASYSRGNKSVGLKSSIAWINDWENPQNLFEHEEFRNYFEGARSMAMALGYHFTEFNVRAMNVSKARLGGILSSRGVRGVLVPPHPTMFEIPHDDWSEFSILRIGFNNPSSKRHIVCSDQFEGGRIAAREMLNLGYKKIGYVGYRLKEEKTRYHFVGGFQMNRDALVEEADRVPQLLLEFADREDDEERYIRWLDANEVEAVFVGHPLVVGWTHRLNAECGRRIGLAGSSIFDSGVDSGIDQRPFDIGEVAMQFLSRLLEGNEFGLPAIPQRLLVSPRWVGGSSLPCLGK